MKLLYKKEIFHQMIGVLSRTAYHNTCSCLISYFFQPCQTLQALSDRHLIGVQMMVMLFIMRFVAKQISIGTRPEEMLVSLTGLFA